MTLSCRGDVPISTEALSDYDAEVLERGDSVFVAGPPGCQTCDIALEPLATLGSISDSVALSLESRPAPAGSGYVINRLIGDAAVAVFDSNGSFLRLIGRAGQGPSEFLDPYRVLAGPGDSIFVLDPSNRKVSVHDAAGEFIYSVPLPPSRAQDFVIDREGRILLMGVLGDGRQTSPALHHISRSGEIVASYGASAGPARDDKPWRTHRLVSVSPHGVIALADIKTYRIEIVRGDSSRFLVRRVPWFLPRDESGWGPGVAAVWLDDEDRLWVTTGVPDPEYDPTGPMTATSLARTLDTIVEVFDATSNTVLVRRRFDEPVVIEEGLAYGLREDSAGHQYVALWRPVFSGYPLGSRKY